MNVLLDTHVWIWWLTSKSPLSLKERTALDAAAARTEICISAISLWEAQMLHAKQRLDLPWPFAQWLPRATDERFLVVIPLDREVVLALDALPASFHGDPADRLIMATARAHHLPLATHDAAIRKARVIKFWKP